MNKNPEPCLAESQAFLEYFGVDCGGRLTEAAYELGLDVVYHPAESFAGALVHIPGARRGYIVINSGIRDESRKRFTLAHEIGHFVLAHQGEIPTPCGKQKMDDWSEAADDKGKARLPEAEANRFASEILMPRELIGHFLDQEPSIETVQSIVETCRTSLTASAARLMTLTPHAAAVVWSERGRVRWYQRSSSFRRWIRRGELHEATLAAGCFEQRQMQGAPEAVPASVWLFEKGLRENAVLWEQSISLSSNTAVLTLLLMRQPVEISRASGSRKIGSAAVALSRQKRPPADSRAILRETALKTG